mgnify:CR=1 FL=1
MDLAKIYGYSTKDFNRQVKNNVEKFEQDFMFQLTNEECEILRCKNSTSSWGGRRYNPYAFTEQGIYMLMTVLKGELATKQSKALIRIFKQMKDYIVDNQPLLGQREYLQLSLQTTQNTQDLLDLRKSLSAVDCYRITSGKYRIIQSFHDGREEITVSAEFWIDSIP